MGLSIKRLPGLFLKSSFMEKILVYFRSAWAEIKKVGWPTKKETYNYTLLVIGISLATAIFLGGLDALFAAGLKLLLKQ
jgi:preprotein translocase subunit SecE